MIITMTPMDGMMTYVMNAEISEQKLRGGLLVFASAPVPQLLPKSVTLEDKKIS